MTERVKLKIFTVIILEVGIMSDFYLLPFCLHEFSKFCTPEKTEQNNLQIVGNAWDCPGVPFFPCMWFGLVQHRLCLIFLGQSLTP